MPPEGQPDLWLIQVVGRDDEANDLRELHWPIGGWLGVELRENQWTDDSVWTGFSRINRAKVFETEASAQQWISNKLVAGIRFQPVRFMAL